MNDSVLPNILTSVRYTNSGIIYSYKKKIKQIIIKVIIIRMIINNATNDQNKINVS